MRVFAILLLLSGSGRLHPADLPSEGVVINKIVVNRSNIFDTSNSEQALSAATALINRFHKTTRESVILREIEVKPGDTVGPEDVVDFERRLRSLGIFAAVSASLVTADEGVELRIDTRDNFSLVAGASGSFLGGIGNVGFRTGDRNLFGTGNQLLFGFSRNTTDDFRGSVVFSDLHFFSKPWRATYRLGRSDEGDFFGVTLGDPFRSLDDTKSWTLTADRTERFIEYYEDGEIVVQLPTDRSVFAGQYNWRFGDTGRYLRLGLTSTYSQDEFLEIRGIDADTIDVPADNRALFLGGLIARDTDTRFVRAQGLDTLSFVQDITLSGTAQIQLGFSFIEDTDVGVNNIEGIDPGSGRSERSGPTASLLLNRALSAGENAFLRFTFDANTTFEDSGERPWTARAEFKGYYTGIKNNTLAARVDYTTGEDGSGLPVQVRLGENNGLRGFDSNQFQGRQRGRINLETRYRPGWRLSVFELGLVGFFDTGFAALRDESISPYYSTGVGLRIGSNALLGGRVMRLDVSKPLNPPDGESDSPTISFAVGQVFRF